MRRCTVQASTLFWCGSAAVLGWAASAALGADQYLDTNGATAGLGINGGTVTWNTTNTNWGPSGDSSGTGAASAWVSGNNAVFAGTAGTLTTAAVGPTVSGLKFNVSGYNIAGVAANTITLNTGAVIDTGANNATISGSLGGTAISFSKIGSGTLTLSGNNQTTYTGTFNINEGEVDLNSTNGTVLARATTTNVGNGTGAANSVILKVIGASATAVGGVSPQLLNVNPDGLFNYATVPITGGSLTFISLNIAGTSSQSGSVLNTVNTTTHLALQRALFFTGGGSLVTTNANNTAGAVALIGNGAVGSGLIYNALAGNNGAMGTLSGNFNIDGALSTGSRIFTIGNDTSLPVDMQISAVVGDGNTAFTSITKTGAGTLEFAGNNTYTVDTIVNVGTLIASSNNAFGTTAGATGLAAGASIGFQGNINYSTAEVVGITGTGDATNSRAGAIDNISGANSFAGAISLTGNSTIGATAGSLTLSGGINGNAAGRTLAVGGAGNVIVDTVGIGSNVSTLTKNGNGTLNLAATNNYAGVTTLSGGTLIVDGSIAASSGVSIAAGTTLGGHGIVSAISGAGLVSPGNSPGILTATSVNPSGGTDFAFEFTATGSPIYGTASASLNDVLRLTGATPFTTSLTSGDVVSIYFDVASLANGAVFKGGFYTDNSGDFLASLSGGTFSYFVLGNGSGTHSFNGVNYYTLSEFSAGASASVSTISESANFGSGAVGGRVTQFTLSGLPVPEPASIASGLFGVTMYLVSRTRRRGGAL